MLLKNSTEFLEQAEAVMPGGVNTSLRRILPPLIVKEAHGAIITDVDGNDYIDYHAAFGPIVLGHSFEPVNRRIWEAMKKIDLIGAGTTEIEIVLARKICECVPSAEQVLFCNSGSESNLQRDPLGACRDRTAQTDQVPGMLSRLARFGGNERHQPSRKTREAGSAFLGQSVGGTESHIGLRV
jgi:hypothetical protein